MQTHQTYPIGKPGQTTTYQHENPDALPSSVVKTFTVTTGAVEEKASVMNQWICLRATKTNGEKFAVWLRSEGAPSDDLAADRKAISSYILQTQNDPPLEFQNQLTGKPVLPILGAWQYLFPKSTNETGQNDIFPKTAKYLGHIYRLTDVSAADKSAAPPGYNLGHVEMGRGNLWGLGELNLERRNRHGVKYRTVMHNFFTEIERAIRLGIAFDLLWDLERMKLSHYREIVRVREDGKVEVTEANETVLNEGARTPTRPNGIPPKLTLDVAIPQGQAPLEVRAYATVTEGSAEVYYTRGADENGIYNNESVLWELFGPEEEDYRFLNREPSEIHINREGTVTTVEISFTIKCPGNYRIRAATVDMAGRTATEWNTITVA